MTEKELKDFLVKAKKSGYAAGGESVVNKESDGSKSTRYEEGVLKFHDNYFGGEPFGGREVVFENGQPCWMMVYYGMEFKGYQAIPTLLKALSNPPENMPVRGPSSLKLGDFKYSNEWHGDIYNFSGEEKIFYQGKQIFFTKYIGGLVDQREG